MKKILLTAVLAIAVSFATTQAQIFIGGNVSFNSTGNTFHPNEGDNTQLTRNNQFAIAPSFGYQINDNFILGARVNFSWQGQGMPADVDRTHATTTFGLNAFAQHYTLEFGRFMVLTEGSIGFGITNARRSGGTGDDEHHSGSNSFNIGVRPVLAFDVSERIRLTTNLNFLSLNYTRTASRTPGDSDDRTVSNTFGLGFNTGNAVNIGGITVGFQFKF